jgi:hypothetical protein
MVGVALVAFAEMLDRDHRRLIPWPADPRSVTARR